jgi:FtsP/CotA-like multicopper oxidase with cupredoxin domain
MAGPRINRQTIFRDRNIMSSWIIDRRALLGAAGQLGGVALAGQATPGWAKTLSQGGAALPPSEVLSGEAITLRIGKGHVTIGGKPAKAITINGTVPGPMLRLKEGQMLRLTVINELDEPSSLHWHGLVLPFQMDGVPGVSFPASRRAPALPTSSPSFSTAPIGITAIRACRR